ncbi:SGNH/GDSL hydrolase family protein [Myxococcus sp. AB056]|uniref:SGNH/GDSL hydrolase family protein n=1 Tax=Myxococcus sp. AB056 TaxID=2562792 RepID=UPI001E386477|nr:SGNH/GDSL hydrolase family protein [Myxococcus sp. AB056]
MRNTLHAVRGIGAALARGLLLASVGVGLLVSGCKSASHTPPLAPDAGALAWVRIPASDARVQYLGRTYRSDTGVVFSHPGVTIRARFWGDAVRMELHDAGQGGEVGTTYFDVVIDGAPARQLAVSRHQSSYLLATGLEVGLHTVELIKRTESLVGHSELVALEVHGELREPPARSGLRMEFVGDSVTCGYGSDVALIPDSPSWTAPTFTSKNQNPRRTYAWLTAGNLGAEAVLICYSGHGVYRNLDMSTSGLVPALYELAVPGHGVAWDFSGPSPDVIVVNAGTNDTFAGSGTDAYLPDEAAFKSAYRAFLTRLRTLHPRAHLVCTLGSMSDGHKQLEQNGTTTSVHVGDWLTELVAERQQQGDARVYRHVMAVQNPNVDGVGEDWHPSAATHQKMAEALTRFIRDVVRP